MADNNFFSINDFTKFARTTRDTLMYYDKIGLLSPIQRGENKYRYYSVFQLSSINMIRTLHALGMTLDEIKKFKQQQTPVHVCKTLEEQIENIDMKIQDWIRARRLLLTLTKTIHSVLDIDETAITVQFMQEETIVLGEPNDYSNGKNDYDALQTFYKTMNEKYPDMDFNYPVWGVFSKERLLHGNWQWPDRFYFYNPVGTDKKPAALYVIGYTRGNYGQSGQLYERLMDYIDTHNLTICGDAYEEYPLNELCISDNKSYLIRIMIPVLDKTCRPD